jgi:hypothetical protein
MIAGAYHAGYNTGFNAARSMNFSMDLSIDYAMVAQQPRAKADKAKSDKADTEGKCKGKGKARKDKGKSKSKGGTCARGVGGGQEVGLGERRLGRLDSGSGSCCCDCDRGHDRDRDRRRRRWAVDIGKAQARCKVVVVVVGGGGHCALRASDVVCGVWVAVDYCIDCRVVEEYALNTLVHCLQPRHATAPPMWATTAMSGTPLLSLATVYSYTAAPPCALYCL